MAPRQAESKRHGHLEGGQKTRYAPVESLFPTLRGIGWPQLSTRRSRLKVLTKDHYALDHDLICIEEQHEVTSSREGVVTRTTRFHLNPKRDYLCQRRDEPDCDYAEQITEYGQTDQGQWYPLEISEYGDRHSGVPMMDSPRQVNVVHLDTNPTFPEDIFNPDALPKRYADFLVESAPAASSVDTAMQDDSHIRVAGRVLVGTSRQPIAKALVRLAAPALDMRDARVPIEQEIHEPHTDTDGRFNISVPITSEMEGLSVDALAPGYGTAAGTFMGGGDDPMLTCLALKGPANDRTMCSNLTILLSEALYVAGIVKDNQGRPAMGVEVTATLHFDRGYGNIAKTVTDAQGQFEIFDFPRQKQPGETAVLSFSSATMGAAELRGLYDLPEARRRTLEIILTPTAKVSNSSVLPPGWSLEYDDGIRDDGKSRIWNGQMAQNLASLRVLPRPADPQDMTWKNENYEFAFVSSAGESVGTINIHRDFHDRQTWRMILKPDRYTIQCRREGGKNPDNFWMNGGPFVVDLSKPGMYTL